MTPRELAEKLSQTLRDCPKPPQLDDLGRCSWCFDQVVQSFTAALDEAKADRDSEERWAEQKQTAKGIAERIRQLKEGRLE